MRNAKHNVGDKHLKSKKTRRGKKLMTWLKSSLNKNTAASQIAPAPTLQASSSDLRIMKPLALKQWKSADEANKLKERLDLKSAPRSGAFSLTEMSAEEHPCTRWMELHNKQCDADLMEKEAMCKCTSRDECRPCQRIQFILEHCKAFVTIDHSNHDKAGASHFLEQLQGYSHIGFAKDFRHVEIYHRRLEAVDKPSPKNYTRGRVNFSDTLSLLKYIYSSLAAYDLKLRPMARPESQEQGIQDTEHFSDVEGRSEIEILSKVSELMMRIKSKKDFNQSFIKLGLLSKGANGMIYAVKSWKSQQFYAMKEICFKTLSPRIMYEILRNWRMVEKEELIGSDTEMYVDAARSTFLIVMHLYKGSMCDLLKETYLQKGRCLTEQELKHVMRNGVVDTLEKMHSQGYIHGDIKPENIVYKREEEAGSQIVTAVVDYDLSARFDVSKGVASSVLSEWRGTLGYSAPEWTPYRHIKSAITSKVDIYSLGLTMLILLCGEQPFLCPTALKQKLLKKDPSIDIKQFVYQTMMTNGEYMIEHFVMYKLAPAFSTELQDLIRAMLLFDPSRRFGIEQVMQHPWFAQDRA